MNKQQLERLDRIYRDNHDFEYMAENQEDVFWLISLIREQDEEIKRLKEISDEAQTAEQMRVEAERRRAEEARAEEQRLADLQDTRIPFSEQRTDEEYRAAQERAREREALRAAERGDVEGFEQPDLWLQSEWAISRMGADGRLSVDGFVKTMHRRLQSGGISIGEITRWLFGDYIILQHQLVANSKLPDNTFRFQREGDRLRFYNLWNSLTFMDSRFDALSTTLHELGLCGDFRRPSHPLTTDGQRLLADGNLA